MKKPSKTDRALLEVIKGAGKGGLIRLPDDGAVVNPLASFLPLQERDWIVIKPARGGAKRLTLTPAGREIVDGAPTSSVVETETNEGRITTADVSPARGKLGEVIVLLSREEGATIADMQAVTGWQVHSIRGMISGAIKKKHGLTVTSQPSDFGRIYRIVARAQQ